MAGFDFSELHAFAADLGKVSDNAGPLLNSAVQHTSVEVKKTAVESVRKGSKAWKSLPTAIGYDIATAQLFGTSVIKSDIGYDRDRDGGRLGNLREFGAPDSPSGPLAPHNDLQLALEANADDFEHGLERAIDDALKRAGL